jgi:hypothetical protein
VVSLPTAATALEGFSKVARCVLTQFSFRLYEGSITSLRSLLRYTAGQGLLTKAQVGECFYV